MSFIRISYSIIFLISVFCLGCTPKEKTSSATRVSKFVVIDNNFTSVNLNHKVLITTNLKKSDLNRKDLKEFILKNSKPTNPQRKMIMVGDYHQYPDAWFYTQLINKTNNAVNLVVDEDNHLRCDGLEVFTFKGDSLKNWGKVQRKTPFSEREIPFYSYAIPISINPKDTLDLLIHTQKNYGIHEVKLNITRYLPFLDKTINQFLSQLVIIVIVLLCMFIMFIIGWLFKDKTMLYLGIYLVFIFLTLISTMGLTDTLINHTTIGLSSNGLGTMLIFLVNAFYHPYGMELMKAVPKNEKRFKIISYSMMAINILAACCFLLPLNLFHKIDLHLPSLMTILGFLSLFWLFYSSLLAFFRAKIKYFFIAVAVAFFPFLYEQLINFFFDAQSPLTPKINQSSFIMSVLGVSIISIFQLREKLISSKVHKENLTQLKRTMEEIRKSEVTGIGRNLHDNVGNILASALGYLNLNNKNTIVVENLVQEAIKEIRFLSHNLVKNEELPIKVKIERLVENFNEFSNINYVFSDYSNGSINKITKEQQINLYYILQELFTNTLRHSFASEVILQIFEDKKRLWITLEDDGIGLKTGFIKKGIGLINIHKRAELSNFKVNIDSTSKGTNTTIEVIS